MDEKMDGIGVLEFLKAKMEKVLTRPKVFIAGLVLGGILVSIVFTVIFNIGKDAGAKEASPDIRAHCLSKRNGDGLPELCDCR